MRCRIAGLFAVAAAVSAVPAAAQPVVEDAEVDALLPPLDETADSAAPAGPLAYIVDLASLEALGIADDFRQYSLLLRDAGEPVPTLAERNRRVRVDAATIADLLRAEGYYDALVEARLTSDPAASQATLAFDIDPGPLYRFRTVEAEGLPLQPGDPVDAELVRNALSLLETELAEQGYVFADIGEPDILVDHRTGEGELRLSVDKGPRARFGGFQVAGDRAPFSAAHVARLARFDRGDPWDVDAIEDLRRALLATGLVGGMTIEPVRPNAPAPGASAAAAAAPAEVDLLVSLEPAPPRTLAAQLSYDTEDGFRVEGSWQHRNLFPPEGAFTATLVAGEQELLASGELRFSNFRHRDQALGARLAVFSEDRQAFYNQGVSLSGYLERETNLIWQKRWTYRVGPELLFTRERDRSASSSRLRNYVIAAFGGRLTYDGTDDLLDPTENIRLTAALSPELSLRGTGFGYARTEIGGSAYLPLDADHRNVLAFRGQLASILGTARGNIAPSRRLYAGGGGSVRGFGFQDVGPQDDDGDPLGGRSRVEASAEGRFRLTDRFGAVIFADAGQVYTSSAPGFDDYRVGVGAGVRYYTSFGPIRADVATPLARRPGEPAIAVYVSIGQAF